VEDYLSDFATERSPKVIEATEMTTSRLEGAFAKEAERISRGELDARKVVVLAGIGTRNYYRRFGYRREGPYMVKELS